MCVIQLGSAVDCCGENLLVPAGTKCGCQARHMPPLLRRCHPCPVPHSAASSQLLLHDFDYFDYFDYRVGQCHQRPVGVTPR
jgi:hypothetical protein